MKKIIENIKKHKVIAIVTLFIVVIASITSVVLVANHNQDEAIKKEQEQSLAQSKKVALKLIENEKEIVKDDEEAIKLQNQLQQAINENDKAKIEALKNQFVAKVVAIKEAQVKTVAKAKESNQNQTEDKKEEDKKEEQASNSNTNVAVNNHSSSTTNNNTTQSVKKEQPKSTTPAPAPKQEQPKKEEKKEEYYPNKYCTYNGNRQRVKNICMYGNADGLKGANEFVIRTNVNNFKTGKVEKIVWKDEPERYYLLEQTGNMAELLEGLKRPSTPANAYCFVNGSCIGFRV